MAEREYKFQAKCHLEDYADEKTSLRNISVLLSSTLIAEDDHAAVRCVREFLGELSTEALVSGSFELYEMVPIEGGKARSAKRVKRFVLTRDGGVVDESDKFSQAGCGCSDCKCSPCTCTKDDGRTVNDR